jgi:osmotically-inducible protein OsmY
MHAPLRIVLWGWLGLVGTVGLCEARTASQQAASTRPASAEDGALQARILASIKKNTALAARNLEVTVDKGVATLKGSVRSAKEKSLAAEIATAEGVTLVRNDLVISAEGAKAGAAKAVDATKTAAEKTGTATKESAQKVGEKTKEIAGKTADKTKDVLSSTGQAITDAWITGKIKAKLSDDTVLKGADIHVSTTGHVVTLSGAVASAPAKGRAEILADGTEGVTSVVNQLTIKP